MYSVRNRTRKKTTRADLCAASVEEARVSRPARFALRRPLRRRHWRRLAESERRSAREWRRIARVSARERLAHQQRGRRALEQRGRQRAALTESGAHWELEGAALRLRLAAPTRAEGA